MNAQETVLIKHNEPSISEPAASTLENGQHVFTTGDSRDETSQIGKTDSLLEMEQAIL